jgi:hypothetical protein
LRDEDSVPKLFRCACCEGPLEPAQQLRFLVETDNLDNPAFLARIRMMPSVEGRPVPVCQTCQPLVEAAPQPLRCPRPVAAPLALATGLLGVFGALSVGLLLGSLFNTRG